MGRTWLVIHILTSTLLARLGRDRVGKDPNRSNQTGDLAESVLLIINPLGNLRSDFTWRCQPTLGNRFMGRVFQRCYYIHGGLESLQMVFPPPVFCSHVPVLAGPDQLQHLQLLF